MKGCKCRADPLPYVHRPGVSALQDAETNWQFDMFAFAAATPGTTLALLTFYLYKNTGLIRDFQLDEQKLCNFLHRVENGYRADNPYHNR